MIGFYYSLLSNDCKQRQLSTKKVTNIKVTTQSHLQEVFDLYSLGKVLKSHNRQYLETQNITGKVVCKFPVSI